MECVATVNVEIERVATPEALVVVVPMVDGPSLNVTVSPEAIVPDPGELIVMVAVNVTDWPNIEGLANELSVVVVFA